MLTSRLDCDPLSYTMASPHGETSSRYRQETESPIAFPALRETFAYDDRAAHKAEFDFRPSGWEDVLCRYAVIPEFTGNGGIVLTAGTYADAIRAAAELGVRDRLRDVRLIRRSAILSRLSARYAQMLTRRSTRDLRDRTPEYSAATGFPVWMRIAWCVIAVMVLAALFSAPFATILNLWVFCLPYFIATMLLRAYLLFNAERPAMPLPGIPERRPVVSILVPVYREADSLPALIRALQMLDYPQRALDIKILLEENDVDTIREARWLTAGTDISCLIVPQSDPRTKPKAMNYALPFARGEIVGIFDAEDAPEPDQILKAVAALEVAGDDVVCAQARLSHYNPTDNLLTRCVAMEYALWFDMLLKGLSRARLPVPLGGTSLYFKTDVLRDIGGWDPDNVTEDADLGLRLARAGKRAVLFDSTTHEEATGSITSWIRQRSRWIKGFMLTWAVHMRDPARLVRELGLIPMLAINVLLLDGFLSFLMQPVVLIAVIATVTMDAPPWLGLMDVPGAGILLGALFAGQLLLLCGAFVAGYRRFGPGVAISAPLLWPYWMLGGFAALIALGQLVTRPQFWEKTTHCTSPVARARRAAVLENGD